MEKERLEVVFRYLAVGSFQYMIWLNFWISEAAVRNFVLVVYDIIWNTIQLVVFKQPNQAMSKGIAEELEVLWLFSHCVGAIDNKLIQIEVISNLKWYWKMTSFRLILW